MYSPPRVVEEESDSNEAHNKVNNLDICASAQPQVSQRISRAKE